MAELVWQATFASSATEGRGFAGRKTTRPAQPSPLPSSAARRARVSSPLVVPKETSSARLAARAR